MPSRASLASDWLSYWPANTTQKPPRSDEKSSESSTPTPEMPSAAKSSAFSRARDSDVSDASTTVQPDLLAGHSASPPEDEDPVEPVEPDDSGVAVGVSWPL